MFHVLKYVPFSSSRFGGRGFKQQTDLILKYGGVAGQLMYPIEDFRSKYHKDGMDFPLVIVPQR